MVSDNSLNVTAGSIILTGTQVIVAAGREAGQSVTEVADGTKAVAGLTVNSGVNLTATKSFDITADTYMTLAGGFSAGRRMDLNSSSGHVTDGKATDTINAGLTIKAGSVLFKNTEGGTQSIQASSVLVRRAVGMSVPPPASMPAAAARLTSPSTPV